MTALLTMLLALNLPSGLASKATSAFSDIQKAKTALDAGKSSTSQSWLTKAQTRLKAVLDGAPGGGLLGKLDKAQGAQQQGSTQESHNALSQEQQAQKVDPSIAGKLGAADQKAQRGDSEGASNELQGAKADAANKSGLGQIQDAYEKVTQAKSLLHAGNTSQAKSLLDQIPSAPQL